MVRRRCRSAMRTKGWLRIMMPRWSWGFVRNVSRKASGALGANRLFWDAAVEMTEPTGAETIVMLRIAGERAIGRVAPDTRLSVGRVERFSIDTRKLCLFDPKTERLIV